MEEHDTNSRGVVPEGAPAATLLEGVVGQSGCPMSPSGVDPLGVPSVAGHPGDSLERVLRGVAVSPGFVVGRAYCIHETTISLESEAHGSQDAVAELARYNEAREKTLYDLRANHDRMTQLVGPREASVFDSQAAILGDESFSQQVSRYILDGQQSAEQALQSVLADYEPVFAAIESEYLRERVSDLRDIIQRLRRYLLSTPAANLSEISGILVVDELLPSDLIPLDDQEIRGVVTQTGGQTSHAAILARSRGIPAVSGIPNVLGQVKTGDWIIVDGHDGSVIVCPGPETEATYRARQREFVHLRCHLAANRRRPAVSADNQAFELLANVNHRADALAAEDYGATGIGLFRTEYLFLAASQVPDEQEQVDAYRGVIAASPGRVVTIRTIDLGGDKAPAVLGLPREPNPFMGWRSIRLCLEHPDLFLVQLRAILRVAAETDKEIRLLFPMVTTHDELRQICELVRQAEHQLEEEHIHHGWVRLGLMVEVPIVAIGLDTFLDAVDFVSIGSNDLVQYLTAADRDNPKVSHLCQPLNPAVLRLLAEVIATCRQADKPVTLCGEMAASARAFALLFGMGLRSFSMSPAFIPAMKELAGHLTAAETEAMLNTVLAMKTVREVTEYMDQQLAQLCPDLALIEIA